MSTHNALLQQVDFPVGFAEQKDQIEDDTVFYVEWLDSNSEFPGLSSSNNEKNLNGGNWELLRRKELDDEELTLVPVEDNAWSNLSTRDSHELYATVAEKNAAELQPTKRVIQPLWPNISAKKTVKAENTEDVYEEDLALELNDIHKSQSRRANRMTSRRKLHDIKTVDIYVEGILSLATSHYGKTTVTWVPYEKDLSNFDPTRLETYIDSLTNTNISNKDKAIRYSSKFTHNTKRYAYKYGNQAANSKRPIFPDSGEFPVQSPIVK
ncbi:uncharacterized protein EV154DRAFT_532398 [Mucor mucedo]|uniref:uncharacterized protein n=1 Tax=Mucor mucedo TaxID=29922 RepID=UPI002220BC69|nr:uncharacterized protein EV154DRAFT_532398 [Mucor mucedo]KAI7866916.1 hypothetical protein EV154DRAFT_532398 [Mucor mucedo]